jgi:GDSL-like Lipase/Acylhydrolase family
MLARRRMLRSLAAGLLYLAFVLALLETSARLALSFEGLLPRIAGEDDSSHRLRWIRSRGRKSSVAYFFDEYHRTRGWALKPGLRELAVFGGKRLSSNSRGLRGAEEHALQKEAGRTRIVVLGDSFTFGEEVSDGETWAARLASLAPEAEVLNLGVHGYGHDQMLLYLREEGLRYKPDVVLLGFVHIDMVRNLLAFRDYAKPRFDVAPGRLALRGSPVPEPQELVAAEPWRSKLMDLLRMLWSRIQERSGASDRRARVVTAALLDEIGLAAASAGAKPALAYLPVEQELAGTDEAPSDGQRFFLDYCAERRVTCLDLRPAFLARARTGPGLKSRGHWGSEEHAIGAAAVRDGLRDQGLLPPPTSP